MRIVRKSAKRCKVLRVKRQVSEFMSSEDGGFVVFSLFMFVTMLIVGGTAVDFARFEADRKRAQATLDNAILSATNLQQSLDSEEVIYSFMEKAGFTRDQIAIDVDEQVSSGGAEVLSRSITASFDLQMPTLFMDYVGVDSLNTTLGSGATEATQNIEISLVLDISGSMGFGPRSYTSIEGLRDAVDEFVNIVLDVDCDADGNNCVQSPDSASTTINVIPYAGHVNPGRDLFEVMGGSRWHNWSSCVEVSDRDFANADLPSDDLRQLAHFMKWRIDNTTMDWGWCPQDDAGILIAENDAQKIKDYVGNIRLHDGTATHIGMKYGVALLNPSSRDAFQALNARSPDLVADDYRFRPANFEDDVQKYVVVMTDGATTAAYRAKNVDYADVYSLPVEEWVGFFEAPYVAPRSATVEWIAIMDEFGSQTISPNLNGEMEVVFNDAKDVEQKYPGSQIYQDRDGNVHNAGFNNANLLETCDHAKEPVTLSNGTTKDDRITVYSIAFNAGNSASNLMSRCASDDRAPYFWQIDDRADNGALRNAFRSIAYSIRKLKLTQ